MQPMDQGIIDSVKEYNTEKNLPLQKFKKLTEIVNFKFILKCQSIGCSRRRTKLKFFTKAGFMSQAVPDLPNGSIGLKIYGASDQGACYC